MSIRNHQAAPTIWNKGSNGFQEENYASDSSSDEEPQVRMRVGEMYQAKVQPWQDNADSTKSSHSKDGMLIWSPSDGISDEELDNFCQIAKEKHSYNAEQALGMLFWHKHDTKKSLSDMQNFTPMPDDWSMEDRVLFEQAYTFHGKNFRKIQQLIPDKDICQLVKHYYTWKKTRMKTSLMDKQASKRRHANDSDDYLVDDGDGGFGSVALQKEHPPSKVQVVDQELEIKHKLPKGIHLSTDDINALASHPDGSEGHLAALDDGLIELKRQVQAEKQICGRLLEETSAPPHASKPMNETEEWSDEEKLLLAEGLKEFGEDFDAISDVLETKTSTQVKAHVTTKQETVDAE